MSYIPKEEIDKKRNELTELLVKGIAIINKHIKNLEKDQSNASLIKDLEIGIDNLKGRIDLINKGEWFEKLFDKPPKAKGRGGFGLSRGFGEFLWQGFDWEQEIMTAVRSIERYYGSM
ncbi:hypothetical protein H1Q59_08395 [Holosporaceae bacterium 'Namur']|nr:hypothetical protein [Holosporaceae bacterium 'Namur']